MNNVKPAVRILAFLADAFALKQICAGLEEEQVLFEIATSKSSAPLDELAFRAAQTSSVDVGIGIREKQAALQMRGLECGQNLFSVTNESGVEYRILGINAARAVKRKFFYEIEG